MRTVAKRYSVILPSTIQRETTVQNCKPAVILTLHFF